MPILHPPRRDPRVLGVELGGAELRWAVADAWHLRGSGTENARIARVAITRLICREKPSAVAATLRAMPLARAAARRFRLPVVLLPKRPIPPASLTVLYADAPLMAPTPAALHLLGRVVRTILEVAIPARTDLPRAATQTSDPRKARGRGHGRRPHHGARRCGGVAPHSRARPRPSTRPSSPSL